MAGTEYPKIHAPYMRHIEGPDKHKLDQGSWFRPEFAALADLTWEWTEKIHGTNVRAIWDGHKVKFGSRTDSASMPVALLETLGEMFPEESFEQVFGENPVVLYGEGFGPKIVKGSGLYGDELDFRLFDVKVGDWWLESHNVADVADKMGVKCTPVVALGSIQYAVNLVTSGVKSQWGDFYAEGLVGKPPLGLLGRDGDRLLVKVKSKDFCTATGLRVG